MNEPQEQESPRRTKGESTASLQVGDNTRKQNSGAEADEFSRKGVKSSGSHTYVNTDVQSLGKRPPSSESLQRDKSSSADVHPSKKKSEKPQSPPNPSIFPSTFQGSVMDTEVGRPYTALYEPTQPSSSTSSSPRNHVITQSDAQPKHDEGKQDVVSAILDDDLRPEVARLPGRKRVASWGTQQDENGPLTNGDHTDGVSSSRGSESAARGSSAIEHNKVNLPHNQFSDVSSESSSRSESLRSSVTKNRKSWDGVRYPGESEEDQKVSRLERPQDNKERSCSDSNLMNLPKEQQKVIQAKHKASQELYELHQQSKTKGNPSYQIEATTSETRDRLQTSPKTNGVGESVFVVEVNKSSGSLGLTLEGGSDTGGDVKIKSIKVRLTRLMIEGSFNCGDGTGTRVKGSKCTMPRH